MKIICDKNKLLLLVLLAVTHCTSGDHTCEEFVEAACPLTEDNILAVERHLDSPSMCQYMCRTLSKCMYFTHFDTQCYMLASCESTVICQGCTSGPVQPDLHSCTLTSDSPTATTDAEFNTTTEITETTSDGGSCPMFNYGSLCTSSGNLIEHIQGMSRASDCQAVCQNHVECGFFSHYIKDSGNHIGHCYLHYDCFDLDHSKCDQSRICTGGNEHHHPGQDDHLDLEGDDTLCNCISGPKYPDLDEC